jgi:predicted nucleic acid-binding protein
MNDAKYFLDTNLLVYANDGTDPGKQEIARRLIIDGISSGNAVLSTQVLGEFWVTATQKIQVTLSREDALKEIDLFRAMRVESTDTMTVRMAIHIQDLHHLSYWDSLILAAARQAGCGRLFSEDLNAGQEVMGMAIENPFRPGGAA